MKIITIILTIFSVNACESTKTMANMQDDFNATKTETLSGKYLISTIGFTQDLAKNMFLEFNDTTKIVSGFAGCNRFSSTYTATENTIQFGVFRVTRKYCKPFMEAEQNFIKALHNVNAFSIKDSVLSLNNDKEQLITASKNLRSKIAKNDVKIVYRAHTRGFLKNIILEDKMVSVQENFNIEPSAYVCNTKDWNALMKLVSDINFKDLSAIDAPSKAHQYDGAPIANFTITKDGETYAVPSFDAGNPNIKIKPLITMVLKIANASKGKN